MGADCPQAAGRPAAPHGRESAVGRLPLVIPWHVNEHLRAEIEARGGVATRRQLSETGVSAAAVRHAVERGHLHRVAKGVYGLHPPRSRAEELRVALAVAGPHAVASHGTAAWIWGLPPEPRLGHRLHVTVPHGCWCPALPGVAVHQATWTEPREKGEWPVTGPRRTLVDLCGGSTLREFRFVALDALHRGLLTLGEFLDGDGVPRQCLRRWRTVGAEAEAGAASGGEAEYWRILQTSHLPLPVLNAPVLQGRFVVDALWEALALVAEIDGRTHHTKEWQWEGDLERQNALHAAGFVVIRFPVARVLGDPGGVAAETAALVHRREAELRVARTDRPRGHRMG